MCNCLYVLLEVQIKVSGVLRWVQSLHSTRLVTLLFVLNIFLLFSSFFCYSFTTLISMTTYWIVPLLLSHRSTSLLSPCYSTKILRTDKVLSDYRVNFLVELGHRCCRPSFVRTLKLRRTHGGDCCPRRGPIVSIREVF